MRRPNVLTPALFLTLVASLAAAGDNAWTPLGPDGGAISSVVVDPTSPSTLWATSRASLFRSTDAGASWTRVYPKGVVALSPHPTTPGSALLVERGTQQAWVTTDSGATWTATGTGLPALASPWARRWIARKPGDPQTIYLARSDSLYRSTDGGLTWAAVSGTLAAIPLNELIVDPAHPATLWVRAGSLGIYRSTDSGVTFAPVNTGLPTHPNNRVPVWTFAADPTAPTKLYVGSGKDRSIYASTNGGDSWTKVSSPAPFSRFGDGLTATSRLLVAPGRPAVLYAGGQDPATAAYHLYRSSDGGLTWANATGNLWTGPTEPLAISQGSPETVYALLADGLYVSRDDGSTWNPVNSGLRAIEVGGIGFDPVTPSTWYFHGGEQGIFKTVNGGATFTAVNAGIVDPVNGIVAVDPANPNVVYAAGATRSGLGYDTAYTAFLVRSTDKGLSWQQVGNPAPQPAEESTWVQPWGIAFAPTSPETIYVVAPVDGVFRSVDSGATFTHASGGLPPADETPYWQTVVTTDATGNGALVGAWRSGGDNPYRTADGGATWAPTTGMPTGTATRNLVTSPADRRTVWAGTNAGVFKSTDAGATWTPASTGLPTGTVYSVVVDPTSPSTLYAGLMRAGSETVICRSTDGGATWSDLGFPASHIFFPLLVLDPANPRHLIAGSWLGLYEITLVESTCTLTCMAAGPSSATTGSVVAFAGSADATDCDGAATYDWDFGDGSAHAGVASPSHTYTSAGTFTWTMTATADGQTCSRTGTVTVTTPCTLACSAGATPGSGIVPLTVAFSGTATQTGCTDQVTYDWDFGDGSPHATTQAASHTYTAGGTYTWRMTATSGGVSCSWSGSVAAIAVWRYLLPGVAHAPGAAGTQWRTDVAAVNRSGSEAALTWVFRGSAAALTRTATLAAGATERWSDILVGLFGLAEDAASSGSLELVSDTPLLVTARTYNLTADGTYGQSYPACEVGDALSHGQVGVLPLLEKSSAFRTNVGVLNLGVTQVTVAIKLFGRDGSQVGKTQSITVDPAGWKQQYDIFANVGAGPQSIAYATVQVQTQGGLVWAYAAVVDVASGDPTTIPVLIE